MYLSHVHLFYLITNAIQGSNLILFENIASTHFQVKTLTSLFKRLCVLDISVSLKSSLSIFLTTRLQVHILLIIIMRVKT